ncbi:unnamed protein product, partial [Rhizoctonia solani]
MAEAAAALSIAATTSKPKHPAESFSGIAPIPDVTLPESNNQDILGLSDQHVPNNCTTVENISAPGSPQPSNSKLSDSTSIVSVGGQDAEKFIMSAYALPEARKKTKDSLLLSDEALEPELNKLKFATSLNEPSIDDRARSLQLMDRVGLGIRIDHLLPRENALQYYPMRLIYRPHLAPYLEREMIFIS